jgi:hypothetical protein
MDPPTQQKIEKENKSIHQPDRQYQYNNKVINEACIRYCSKFISSTAQLWYGKKLGSDIVYN